MNRKDSEDLVRVGPGTVMGELMRQYWVPAAMSAELKADGDPMRLVLLGEKLIAFRDSSGRVGIMDHNCPHRCASLFLGRNEENGIRCIYHGWKFDADGNCVDTPNLADDPDFKNRIKAKAYQVAERNGLVWVYMGKRAEAPPLPQIEATLLPESEVTISLVQRECNWLQALEGDIDTSHFGFLHAGGIAPDVRAGRQPVPLYGDEPRPGIPRDRHRRRHDVCGLPRGRAGPDLLAFRQFHVAVLDADAARQVHRAPAQPRLGADGRHPYDVRQPDVAAAPAITRPGQARPHDAGLSARLRLPAEHDRLVRPLAARGPARERLADRPRRAAQRRQLHRHRGHPRAGPGGDREHGADHRSCCSSIWRPPTG